MTNPEFSYEFDILYNNIMSNQAPGLDEYEKSVFLTKALEEITVSLYTGKYPLYEGFESTEEIRRYLNSLYETYIYNNSNLNSNSSSLEVNLPPSVLFIVYESAIVDNKELMVVPTTYDEYHRVKRNPFRQANSRRVLRLEKSGIIILDSIVPINSYKMVYLRKPQPIILTNLSEGLTINDSNKETPCELPEALHRTILERAVQLAKISMKNS